MTTHMRQFDVVIARLTGRGHADEETLTDLLNERARAGWNLHTLVPLGPGRVVVVFHREAG